MDASHTWGFVVVPLVAPIEPHGWRVLTVGR
jgi:hypothetical protein